MWMGDPWLFEGGVVSVFSILGSSENKRMRDEHLGICLESGKIVNNQPLSTHHFLRRFVGTLSQ